MFCACIFPHQRLSTVTMSAILPSGFNDSIQLRANNLRFRGVGSPYVFLDSIGLIPIKEFLYRGANIIELAEALNLPLTIIHKWIEGNNYQPEIQEASVISAEGYIWRGETMLANAKNKFELDKAKTMLEHGRFMASKKNKKVYGNTQDVGSGAASVTYQFNIGTAPPVTMSAHKIEEALNGEYTDLTNQQVSFSLADEFLNDLGPTPDHLAAMRIVRPPELLKSAPATQAAPATTRETRSEQDHWMP